MQPNSRPPASIDRELLEILERAFAEHAGADAVIDIADLQKALGLTNPYFARRVLKVLDTDGDGVVRKQEFLAGLRAVVAGTDQEKLLFAFKIHDHDGDGTLDRDELLRMITISLAESQSTTERQSPEALVKELLKRGDRDGDGRLSFEELERLVSGKPHLLQRMVRSEAIWIAPNEELLRWLDKRAGGQVRPDARKERNLAPVVILGAVLLANLAVFGVTVARGLDAGQQPLMQVGRALGACISLDGALILLPMMRRLLTRVRSTWLGRLLPIDDAVEFHRVVGHALFFLAMAHAATFLVVHHNGHRGGLARLLFATNAGLTGSLLVAVFSIMWVCSLSFVRRTRAFELFYFTHLLYVVWLALAVIHAPRFLLWVGVPLFGFLVEQVLRIRRRGRRSTIVTTQALRSGVTRLELARPAGFTFEPADYAFLRVPKVARHEWHPFTISSAPERGNLVFHVRSLGNWTAALRGLVEAEAEPKGLPVYVDGPYGSPSAEIFESKFAVLIAGGIGVTPFASVLESLVLRGNGSSDRPSKLRHAHFYWLARDQYAFEWFGALLGQLEKSDAAGMLEMHLCMTEVRSGATSFGLELAREAMRTAGRSDAFTGLRTHTHLGPPDWDVALKYIAHRHAPEPVQVFFCGPPALGKKIRAICEGLGMPFREEKF